MVCGRILHVSVGEKVKDVGVRFDQPIDHGTHWTCGFEIDWPSGPMKKEAEGIDSVQALLLAFQMAGTILYVSSYHEAGLLWWDKPGDGYGFPTPTGMRDILVGRDKRF